MVETAYRLFVDVMTRGREAQDNRFDCNAYGGDHFLFEGILDGAVIEKGMNLGIVITVLIGAASPTSWMASTSRIPTTPRRPGWSCWPP